MDAVTNTIHRERMPGSDILAYQIDYVGMDAMMRLSDDILQQIQINSFSKNQLLLLDLTAPDAGVPYLSLSNRDLFNVGITSSGRRRLTQYLKLQPETRIYVAVVLADNAAGQLAQSYASGQTHAQIVGKLFFDRVQAEAWLVSQRSYRSATGQLDTHRLDKSMLDDYIEEAAPENLQPGQNELFLFVRGAVEVLTLEDQQRLIIGRTKLNADWHVDVDLSSYGKVGQTVSRQHATLHWQDGTLYLTDLSSTNGTYIDGERISPNVPYNVTRERHITLGKLEISLVY